VVDLERTTSAADVAGELGVSVEAVRRRVAEGILPGVRAGRSWLVDTVGFEEWKVVLADRGSGPVRGDVRAIRQRILGELLNRMGISQTPGSWQRHGGRLPTWAEAVLDGRRHGSLRGVASTTGAPWGFRWGATEPTRLLCTQHDPSALVASSMRSQVAISDGIGERRLGHAGTVCCLAKRARDERVHGLLPHRIGDRF